jgi:hypothetical protein
LVLGAGIGFGGIHASDCDNCGGGFAWEFHLGGMVNPRFGLMFDVSEVIRPVNDGFGDDLTNTIYTVAGQFWLVDRLWVKGGVGLGHISFSGDLTGDDTAGAVMGGLGIEVLQSYWFAMDLQARVSYAGYSGGGATNGMGLIGFNWY